MKDVLYYHIYLTDDVGTWSSIVMEHLKMMEDFGLTNVIDKVRITAISQNDSRFVLLSKLFSLYFPPDKMDNLHILQNPYYDDVRMLNDINSTKTVDELQTMKRIWNDSQEEDMNILYLHTKGITSTLNHLESGNVNTFRNYYYWRQYLNWGVIENWKKCRDALKIFDIAGVNYYDKPAKHYSGAFWWARSDYIRNLPDPSSTEWWKSVKEQSKDPWLMQASDRFKAEMWPCSSLPHKPYNVMALDQSKNPAGTFLPRMEYEGGENIFWHPV